jgi:O-antigen ligase
METNLIFSIALWALRASLVLFTFISWKNPKWGIYLICALLPTYLIRFNILGIPATALEVMTLVLFGIWAIKNLRLKKSLKFTNVKISDKFLITGVAVFLLAATISMFLSPDFRAAAGIWKAYFIEPLMFLAVFISIIKKDDIKNVIKALGFSALYISLYAFAQKFLGAPITIPWQAEMRATSIFNYPNAVGLYLAPLIPLFIHVILGDAKRSPGIHVDSPNKSGNDKIKNIFLIVACILSVISIIFAKSEGALVALVAGFGIFLFIKLKNRGKIILSVIGSVTIAAILFLNFTPFPQVKEKLLLNDWSGMVRKTVWSETWEMLKDAPVLGVGLSGYQTAIIPYHNAKWMEIFLYPHNIILNFWSETGILGLLGFILIIIGFYKKMFENSNIKNTDSPYFILVISMTVLLVHGLVDVPYFKNDLSILFWALVGLTIVSDNTKRG